MKDLVVCEFCQGATADATELDGLHYCPDCFKSLIKIRKQARDL